MASQHVLYLITASYIIPSLVYSFTNCCTNNFICDAYPMHCVGDKTRCDATKGHCNVHCDENAFRKTGNTCTEYNAGCCRGIIYCPDNYQCRISCGFNCNYMTVHANSSTYLEITGCGEGRCDDMTVFCPQQLGSTCIIKQDSAATMYGLNIHTLSAFSSMSLNGAIKDSNMWCYYPSTTSCVIDVADDNTKLCYNSGVIHCLSPKPTISPTYKPTPKPTNRPTAITPYPTLSPTQFPTYHPTKSPITAYPTVSPTNYPTKRPTNRPTHSPTMNPTKGTYEPTMPPTKYPTDSSNVPTPSPTKPPTTYKPTAYVPPTYSPTDDPSVSPTYRPTNRPTFYPTVSPTYNPTMSPTNYPTKRPTNTNNPTKSPTYDPTKRPTNTPTVSPTQRPTDRPTVRPTASPTDDPSVRPTTQAPTDDPTQRPTNNPTKKPTDDPTKRPTNNPTKRPTDDPSISPTKNPTDVTLDPSKTPTGPTSDPTESPTSARPTTAAPSVNLMAAQHSKSNLETSTAAMVVIVSAAILADLLAIVCCVMLIRKCFGKYKRYKNVRRQTLDGIQKHMQTVQDHTDDEITRTKSRISVIQSAEGKEDEIDTEHMDIFDDTENEISKTKTMSQSTHDLLELQRVFSQSQQHETDDYYEDDNAIETWSDVTQNNVVLNADMQPVTRGVVLPIDPYKTTLIDIINEH